MAQRTPTFKWVVRKIVPATSGPYPNTVIEELVDSVGEEEKHMETRVRQAYERYLQLGWEGRDEELQCDIYFKSKPTIMLWHVGWREFVIY